MRRSYPFVLAIGMVLLFGPGGDHIQSGSLDSYRLAVAGMRHAAGDLSRTALPEPIADDIPAAGAGWSGPSTVMVPTSPAVEHSSVQAREPGSEALHTVRASRLRTRLRARASASESAAVGVAKLQLSEPAHGTDQVVAGGGETGSCVTGVEGHEPAHE